MPTPSLGLPNDNGTVTILVDVHLDSLYEPYFEALVLDLSEYVGLEDNPLNPLKRD
jgi:hypothetical protein